MGRWELKAVIDDECRRGLEQLKGLLSHVDPRMTLGQIVERAVREAVERHDPARPPRGRRTGSRAALSGADETSAPKVSPAPEGVVSEPAHRKTAPAGVTASPAKAPGDSAHRDATAAKRPGVATQPSAPKEPAGPDSATAPMRPASMPATVTTSPAKVKADSEHDRAVVAKRPATAARSATSAPKELTLVIPVDGKIVQYLLTSFGRNGEAVDQEGVLSEEAEIGALLSSVLAYWDHDQSIKYSPNANNRAHTSIVGAKTMSVRKMLAQAAKMLYP